jgi:hypothetical protein
MKIWEQFFAKVDPMPAGLEREAYLDLLRRNFDAAGSPTTWPGFASASPELQQKLMMHFTAWAGS